MAQKLGTKLADLTYKAQFNKIKALCIKAAKEERTSIQVLAVKPHTKELLEAEGINVEHIDHQNYKAFRVTWEGVDHGN